VPASPTPMIKSVLWIICMSSLITIISASGIPDDRSVYIVNRESVIPRNGGSWLSDRGSPLLKRG
jgi:hypothetical protein